MNTAISAAFGRVESRKQGTERVQDKNSPFSKRDIMTERQLRTVEVVPVNQTHEVYLFIAANPGKTSAEICKAFEGNITNSNVNNAIRGLFSGSFIARSATGTLNRVGNPEYFYRLNPEMEYVPKPIVRKIAPNDKKALKSLERQQAQAKKAPFELVNGIIAVDNTNPQFEDIAKTVGATVEKQEIPNINPGPDQPIVSMFFDLGDKQSVVLTPEKAYRLYQELHRIFGQKD